MLPRLVKGTSMIWFVNVNDLKDDVFLERVVHWYGCWMLVGHTGLWFVMSFFCVGERLEPGNADWHAQLGALRLAAWSQRARKNEIIWNIPAGFSWISAVWYWQGALLWWHMTSYGLLDSWLCYCLMPFLARHSQHVYFIVFFCFCPKLVYSFISACFSCIDLQLCFSMHACDCMCVLCNLVHIDINMIANVSCHMVLKASDEASEAEATHWGRFPVFRCEVLAACLGTWLLAGNTTDICGFNGKKWQNIEKHGKKKD